MRVMLIDDHPLILSALQRIVQDLDAEVEVVPAQTAAAARGVLAEDEDFDLLLLDLSLPDANGHVFLAELRRAHPALPVVVVSASESTADVIRAIDGGAMGFVSKRCTPLALVRALRDVMRGAIVVPEGLQPEPVVGAPAWGTALQRAAADPAAAAFGSPAPTAPATLERLGLTPRQREVLGLLLLGKPNKLIARELSLSVETVKDHVAAVLRALNVATRTQAVLAVGRLSVAAPQELAPWTQRALP
jgi:DNA-binding NarL/FixJ family response regulator